MLYLYKCQGLAYRLPSRCLAQTMYGLSNLTLSYSVVYWSILGSWGRGGALNCSACQFLRCKYSYYSWFQTINVKSADLQNSWEFNHWSLKTASGYLWNPLLLAGPILWCLPHPASSKVRRHPSSVLSVPLSSLEAGLTVSLITFLPRICDAINWQLLSSGKAFWVWTP